MSRCKKYLLFNGIVGPLITVFSGKEIPSQTAFVRDAMIRRLQMTLTVKETWPEAMAALSASPEGIKGALGNLAQLADDIWFFAGDKSTDTNW